MYTDKAIFKGTPAQFHAVFEDFNADVNHLRNLYNRQFVEPSRVEVRRFRGEITNVLVSNVVSDTPRVVIGLNYPGVHYLTTDESDFTITATVTHDHKTQVTFRVYSEDDFAKLEQIWESLLGYAGNLGWFDDGYEKLLEPEDWIGHLKDKKLSHSTPQWWVEVERMTERYWSEHGKRKLTIARLAEALAVQRDDIYEKTMLRARESK